MCHTTGICISFKNSVLPLRLLQFRGVGGYDNVSEFTNVYNVCTNVALVWKNMYIKIFLCTHICVYGSKLIRYSVYLCLLVA